MVKLVFLFAFLLFINLTNACQVTVTITVNNKCRRTFGRFLTADEEINYLNYMNNVDWKLLKSNNVSLDVSGDKYELSRYFIDQMKNIHSE